VPANATVFLNDLWMYDILSDVWTQKEGLPEDKLMVGIVFSSSSKGYIGLSENTGNLYGKMHEYDPTHDAWRIVQQFPSGSSRLTSAFTLEQRMFVLGGFGISRSKQVWEFIP
jgi:N-acetylneuraminic acid mutarotase